jgi:hypothetical protein
MNYTKFWLRSKTILFNIALTAVGSWTTIEASAGNLKESMTPAHFGILLTALGVLGFVLRIATTTAVSMKEPKK